MPETVQKLFKIVIKADLHDVWAEITRTDAPIKCFFNSKMDVRTLAPGSKLAMRTPNGKFTGVVGEIIEFIPPRKFSHTFRFTNMDDPPCKVVYELNPVEGGTEFVMRIEDLVPDTKTAKQMTQGASIIMNTLKNVMETGKPSFGIRVLYGLFGVLQMTTPRQCRSENWKV